MEAHERLNEAVKQGVRSGLEAGPITTPDLGQAVERLQELTRGQDWQRHRSLPEVAEAAELLTRVSAHTDRLRAAVDGGLATEGSTRTTAEHASEIRNENEYGSGPVSQAHQVMEAQRSAASTHTRQSGSMASAPEARVARPSPRSSSPAPDLGR